ncbi:MAG: Na+/H+ antiporter subunit G [Alteromonadaceae bacterium]|nr:Na+/H+ antiporter subunit G [Alteromonadaceae bacterium]|tara:strand:+ start:3897 stop:4223 length:327 start_codon:yes stop_codon:yes gene_type:complete
MSWIVLLQIMLLLAGTVFFIVGTVGLLRLPDTFTRLHALTKVDNLGLGLIILGLMPGVSGVAVGLKLVLVWLLTLGASTTVAYLVANASYLRSGPDRQAEAAEGRGER